LVLEGEKAIRKNNIADLGDLMNTNHGLLARDLGVSHPKLNKLVDVAIEAGAYGAKLSGGGKGGVMIALTDFENKENVSNAIRKAGGTPHTTKIGVEGLRIE